MKVTILENVDAIPERKEGLTLLLYFKDGEVIASNDWYRRKEGYIEIYNHNEDSYDSYIIKYVIKIVLLEGEA